MIDPPAKLQRPANKSIPGIIILGGAHNALALARSFGRRKVRVVFVTDDHPLPKYSHYVRASFDWRGADAEGAADWLMSLAGRNRFNDWLLIPCADNEVKFVAENQDQLRQTFQMVGCSWDRLHTLCNKELLVAAADQVGIAVPKSYAIENANDVATIDIEFPVIMKPAMRLTSNALTSAKAWRADSRAELAALYDRAASLKGRNGIVVQEYIPGGGKAQFSYAALWSANAPVAEFAARRTRQYPVEFG